MKSKCLICLLFISTLILGAIKNTAFANNKKPTVSKNQKSTSTSHIDPRLEERAHMQLLMHSFYRTFEQLRPYLKNLESFSSEKKKVSEILKALDSKISDDKPTAISVVPGFNVTYSILSRHLKEGIRHYEKSLFDSAYSKINATPGLCIACHDRLPKPSNIPTYQFSDFADPGNTEKQLQDAEFYYLAHDFETALQIYDRFIRSYKSPKVTREGSWEKHKLPDFQPVYERKITYFARISRNPDLAIKSLAEDLKNEELPLEVKENIKSWIHYFTEWKKEGEVDPSKFSDEKLVTYAKDFIDKYTGGRKITISDPYIVNVLRISGLLYERVFKKEASPHIPDMLYLLGKCEKDLGSIRIFSLAEVYWRECVLKYPKSPAAKLCYAAYEADLKAKYSGPAFLEVQPTLENMKNSIKDN